MMKMLLVRVCCDKFAVCPFIVVKMPFHVLQSAANEADCDGSAECLISISVTWKLFCLGSSAAEDESEGDETEELLSYLQRIEYFKSGIRAFAFILAPTWVFPIGTSAHCLESSWWLSRNLFSFELCLLGMSPL